MKVQDIIAGIEILTPYYDNLDYQIGAEHDQIYMYQTDTPVSDEDMTKLKELGWFQEGVEEDSYDVAESWSAFV